MSALVERVLLCAVGLYCAWRWGRARAEAERQRGLRKEFQWLFKE